MCTDASHINLPHEAIFEPYALSEFISKDEAGFGLYLTKKILDKMRFELYISINEMLAVGNIGQISKELDTFSENNPLSCKKTSALQATLGPI